MEECFTDRGIIAQYCAKFNQQDEELYQGDIPNSKAAEFLTAEIPVFECPDPEFQEIWYFRWWTFRKHIQSTPFGRVITEFLPEVPWSGPFNTINCPAAHQLREARWLNDKTLAENYLRFYLNPETGAGVRQYTFGPAVSALDLADVTGNKQILQELYPALCSNYGEWKKSHLKENGLFYQVDGADGMECSIGGSGYRATINSCMAAEALALAEIAGPEEENGYRQQGEALRARMEDRLWNEEKQFFMSRQMEEAESFVDVRELHGYTPWYYFHDMPEKYDTAWTQLMDPDGFLAPYGPATAERRHPGFVLDLTGHECQWNGPSWPFSTAVTLTGLANLLQSRKSHAVNERDYFETLSIYTGSHYIRKDGIRLPWIDENLDPFTGEWLSRRILLDWEAEGRRTPAMIPERGKDYLHSTYADLIITGLCGIRPDISGTVTVHPLLPAECWNYFLLDGIKIQGHTLTLLYDRDGSRYSRGKGLRLYVDGTEAASGELGKDILQIKLPSAEETCGVPLF